LTHHQPVTVVYAVVRIWSSERGVDWARWLVAGGVLICSAPAGRGGERY
jgi:hypothetical protein